LNVAYIRPEARLSEPQARSEIALACGMADQPHFSNVFRRMTGETPSRWRTEHRHSMAKVAEPA
jgi:AraC-like DNA-binding protein